MPNDLARSVRLLKTIDEKLDLALTGHGERLTAVEGRVGKLEKVQDDHGRLIRWLCKKVERSHGKR